MLDVDDNDGSPSDVLTLINQAMKHVSSLVGDAKFRYNQPVKAVAALDGAFAALQAAQVLEQRNREVAATNAAVMAKLNDIGFSIDKIGRKIGTPIVASKISELTKDLRKRFGHTDPLPGTH